MRVLLTVNQYLVPHSWICSYFLADFSGCHICKYTSWMSSLPQTYFWAAYSLHTSSIDSSAPNSQLIWLSLGGMFKGSQIWLPPFCCIPFRQCSYLWLKTSIVRSKETMSTKQKKKKKSLFGFKSPINNQVTFHRDILELFRPFCHRSRFAPSCVCWGYSLLFLLIPRLPRLCRLYLWPPE